jgi:Zn-dependent protease
MIGIYYHLPVFGWAKPVPVDARNFKEPFRDMGLVAAAGPASNVVLAVISTALLAITIRVEALQTWVAIAQLLVAMIQLNLMLAVLTLLPCPPLDGFRIIQGLLPKGTAIRIQHFERYSVLILVVLLFSGGLKYLYIPVAWGFYLLMGLAGIPIGGATGS